MGVASRSDQGDGGEFDFVPFHARFHDDGVDVALEVVDGDDGARVGEGDGLGEGHADEKGTDEAGAFGDGDGGEIGVSGAGARHGVRDDGDDGAEVFARGEFGDDTAVLGVGIELRGDDGGKHARAVCEDGGGGFVAGAFDT